MAHKRVENGRASSARDRIGLVADSGSGPPLRTHPRQRPAARTGPDPHSRPRRALVLGAGGVLGAAWMTGALAAAQEVLKCAVSDVDLMIGTSAGSVLAAALRCGVGIDELVAYQRGEPIGLLEGIGELHRGPWPRPPRLRLGSPRLALTALTAPHRVIPAVHASAWLPIGRENHANLRAMVGLLHSRIPVTPADTQLTAAAAAVAAPGWVTRQTWVVAVDYDSGRRVAFGRPGAPAARLADAVVASCSLPGWYEPVVIGGRRYIDGGVRSVTSLGLLAGEDIDEVCVLAPMASVVADRKYAPHMHLERRVRSLLTWLLMREAAELRATGVKVTLLTPGPEDLAVMGINLMDPRRREAVLETSLRTSAATLAAGLAGSDAGSGRAAA